MNNCMWLQRNKILQLSIYWVNALPNPNLPFGIEIGQSATVYELKMLTIETYVMNMLNIIYRHIFLANTLKILEVKIKHIYGKTNFYFEERFVSSFRLFI